MNKNELKQIILDLHKLPKIELKDISNYLNIPFNQVRYAYIRYNKNGILTPEQKYKNRSYARRNGAQKINIISEELKNKIIEMYNTQQYTKTTLAKLLDIKYRTLCYVLKKYK